MLHTRYFCKKTVNNTLKRKITDYNEEQSIKISESLFEQQPSQLTTVTNQFNNKKVNSKQHVLKSTTNCISPNLIDYINNQNTVFYAKYMQNLQLIMPRMNTFLQNQIHEKLTPPLNLSSVYSVPSSISSIFNNQFSLNYKQKGEKYQKKELPKKKSKNFNNKTKYQYKAIQAISSMTQKLHNSGLVSATVSSLNFQDLQNCCAKCNTRFRLTSDLVYHMRTFHRRDETFTQPQQQQTKVFKERETKQLKCEICHENFKEKHHLTRHMTSHR
jgi:hypothetical protein